jgi:hypothetical protein
VELAEKCEVVGEAGAEHGVLLPQARVLFARAPSVDPCRGSGRGIVMSRLVPGAMLVSVVRDLGDLDEGVRHLQGDLVRRGQSHRRFNRSIGRLVSLRGSE